MKQEVICSSLKEYFDLIVVQVSKFGYSNIEPSADYNHLIFWLESTELKFGIALKTIHSCGLEEWKSFYDVADFLNADKPLILTPNLVFGLFKYVIGKSIEDGQKLRMKTECQQMENQ